MARNISFFLTKRQFLDRSKDVTRRLGWNWVKPGDVLCGIEKGQGLKRGSGSYGWGISGWSASGRSRCSACWMI